MWNGPYVMTSGDPAFLQFYGVVCSSCCSTAVDEKRERAIGKWNTRVQEQSTVTLQAEVKGLREALIAAVIPYEALLIDSESRKWIAPEVWAAIENAVAALRAALPPQPQETKHG